MPVAAPAKQLQAALLLQNEGLALSKSATYTIGIAAGRCVVADASGNRDVAILSSAITKVLNSAWASGSGNGMLDTGSVSNTWYHCWLIYNQSTGAVDAIASLSFSAPALSGGFTFYNYLGSVWVQSASIVDFDQYPGGIFVWRDERRDIDNVAVPTSRTFYTVSCPPNIPCEVQGFLSPGGAAATGSLGIYVSGPDQTDFAPTNADPRAGNYNCHASGTNNSTYEYITAGQLNRRTSTGQLGLRRVGTYVGGSNQTTWRTDSYRNLRLAAIAGSSSGGNGVVSVAFASLGTASAAGAGAVRFINDYNITVFSDGSVWRPLGRQILSALTVTAAVTGTTSKTNAWTFVVPGGLLHANSIVSFTLNYGATSNANNKVIALDWGSNSLTSTFTTNSLSATSFKQITFKNSLSSQSSYPNGPVAGNSFAGVNTAMTSLTQNFASNVTVGIAVTLANSGDTFNLFNVFFEWIA